MWDEFDRQDDHRSDDAKIFQLPVKAQGPTYFRWSSTGSASAPVGIALFLDYGLGGLGKAEPFARLAVLVDDKPSLQSMDRGELEQFAAALFDEIDRREKLDVTLPSDAPATALAPTASWRVFRSTSCADLSQRSSTRRIAWRFAAAPGSYARNPDA